MVRAIVYAGMLSVTVGGCAKQPEPAAAPASTAVATAAQDAAPVVTTEVATEPKADPTLPVKCSDASMCTLPTDFAERLCKGVYPEVALHLFAPSTPWKRAYLRKSFKAWHVGGRGELRELRAGEEVIVASVARDAGGIQIGGKAFEILRWDGTCVSLMEDELNFSKPPNAVPANITWKNLDKDFQSALSAEKQIEMLRANETKICDAPSAEQEPGKSKCEIARRQLSLAIAQWVGRGKALPPLASIP